jgi:hypothetical protein
MLGSLNGSFIKENIQLTPTQVDAIMIIFNARLYFRNYLPNMNTDWSGHATCATCINDELICTSDECGALGIIENCFEEINRGFSSEKNIMLDWSSDVKQCMCSIAWDVEILNNRIDKGIQANFVAQILGDSIRTGETIIIFAD